MNSFLLNHKSYADIAIAILGIAIIMMMIFPVHTGLLDILLAVNISFALIIMVVTMYLKRPVDFSVFPSVLLFATLFRLSLNVSSTRLILLHGYAGEVIQAFGDFVVGGNYLVGVIIFAVIYIIQVKVITNGSSRIAEVAARFTLDAMPGKQMSIDADLNAGLLTEDEARKKREDLRREADFYGAMDGASRFVKGDVSAGLIITGINIIGGIVMGMWKEHLPFVETLSKYTILTVGDGLVAQIPSLIIAMGSGILVSRAASEAEMGKELFRQLSFDPRVLLTVSIATFVIGIIPGLPTAPFIFISLILGLISYLLYRYSKIKPQISEITSEDDGKPKGVPSLEEASVQIDQLLKVDVIEVEIGYSLIPYVDIKQGGDLLDRISSIRKQFASELGIIIPPIRIRDNIKLKPNQYNIKIKGDTVAHGELMVNYLLAMNPGTAKGEIPGIKTKEPTYNLPAVWIQESLKDKADSIGYTVVSPPIVLVTHLTETIRTYASEILTRQGAKELLDKIKERSPALIEETFPKLISLGVIHKIFQYLIKENISIRNLEQILEVIADHAPYTKDPRQLSEYIRQSLGRSIIRKYIDDDGKLFVIALNPSLEQKLIDFIEKSRGAKAVEPALAQAIVNSIIKYIDKFNEIGKKPVILTDVMIRLFIRQIIEASNPNVSVLSYNEVDSTTPIEVIGKIEIGS